MGTYYRIEKLTIAEMSGAGFNNYQESRCFDVLSFDYGHLSYIHG